MLLRKNCFKRKKFWFKKDNLLRMGYHKCPPWKSLMILNKRQYVYYDDKRSRVSNFKSNKLFQQINKITVDCAGYSFSNRDFVTKVYENKSTYIVEMSPVGKALKEFFFKTIDVVIKKRIMRFQNYFLMLNENSGDILLSILQQRIK